MFDNRMTCTGLIRNQLGRVDKSESVSGGIEAMILHFPHPVPACGCYWVFFPSLGRPHMYRPAFPGSVQLDSRYGYPR